jgi:hypothetical protein
MIDLSMVCRKDGKTAREALEDEPIGFALSYTPDGGSSERTLVVRWPAFVTFVLVLSVLALVAGRI